MTTSGSGRPRRALVTGATSGIGLAFAEALAAQGHEVVLVAPASEDPDACAAGLSRRHGVRCVGLVADLTDRADVARVADAARSVDVLVNNAGFGLEQWFLDNPVETERGLLDVLCRAVLVISHGAASSMRERGHGRIVNVASLAGWVAGGTYSAAKSWLITFSEGLATELHGSGVTVTVTCPGFVRTRFHERSGISVELPDRMWLDAERVAAGALRASERGRVVHVPGLVYRGLGVAARLAPRSVVRSGGVLTRHRPPLR